MQKCMICQSGRKIVTMEGVTLCLRCLTVIYEVMKPKIMQSKFKSRKKPKPH